MAANCVSDPAQGRFCSAAELMKASKPKAEPAKPPKGIKPLIVTLTKEQKAAVETGRPVEFTKAQNIAIGKLLDEISRGEILNILRSKEPLKYNAVMKTQIKPKPMTFLESIKSFQDRQPPIYFNINYIKELVSKPKQ